jgi:hypothetical protein
MAVISDELVFLGMPQAEAVMFSATLNALGIHSLAQVAMLSEVELREQVHVDSLGHMTVFRLLKARHRPSLSSRLAHSQVDETVHMEFITSSSFLLLFVNSSLKLMHVIRQRPRRSPSRTLAAIHDS